MRIINKLLASTLMLVFSNLAWPAVEANSVEQAVKTFLASKENIEDQESAQLQGSGSDDLDNDGSAEIILVWTTLGPSYWSNTLTVLKKVGAVYREVGSVPLNGEAELGGVKAGVISVNQKTFAPGDPSCCPSVAQTIHYRWRDGKLAPVK